MSACAKKPCRHTGLFIEAVLTELAVEKDPDARRRAPRAPEAYFSYVEGCRKLAKEADGP